MHRYVRAALAALAACCLTFVTALLLAGHGPWAGRTLLDVTFHHGLNTGDIPVLIAWAIGVTACGLLSRE